MLEPNAAIDRWEFLVEILRRRDRCGGASELVEIAAYGRHAHPEIALELSDGYRSLMCEQCGIDRADLCDAAERAEARLAMPVNPVLCPAGSWDAPGKDGLLVQIK